MQQTDGVYLISVVADRLAMHPQTLRKYERAGFVAPLRMGTLRAYSDEDVARLRLIKHFVDDLGLNLSGVEMALKFTNELLEVRLKLSSCPDPGGEVAESIHRVDAMLAHLGVRVVPRPELKEPVQEPGDGGFRVNPDESLEFDSQLPA